MRKLVAWSVCFLLGGGAMAQDGSNAPGKKTASAIAPVPQIVIELTAGSWVIGAPVVGRFKITTPYAKMEFQLSQASTIVFDNKKHTAQVKFKNGDVLNGKLAVTEIAVKTDSGKVVAVPLAKMDMIVVRGFPASEVFENSLGMRFVPVPGTAALFSIWDTRVRDYRAYAEANPGVNAGWKNPGVKQGEDHPVLAVNWNDAKAFCAWLTAKERKEGKIGQDQEYRLPTDQEWSAAVGAGKYPWGNEWPPSKGAGNYADSLKVDGYKYTSPVGSFAANQYGLYDMGGNVWQWCEDLYRADMSDQAFHDEYPYLKNDGAGEKSHVVRGGSWYEYRPEFLLSSFRFGGPAGFRSDAYGFRCVLAPVAVSK